MCTHRTHARAHIIHMSVHTSYACSCTHDTHVRAHTSYAYTFTHRTLQRTHTHIHAVIACFSFCGGKFILCCCGASLWCCVCVHIIHMPSHTSYACPYTHPTHARTHIICYVRAHASFVRMPVNTSYAPTHAYTQTCIQRYILTRIPTPARMFVQDTSTY